MEMIYVLFCYAFMLGMIIEDFEKPSKVWAPVWLSFIFAPIIVPMILGIYFCEKYKK